MGAEFSRLPGDSAIRSSVQAATKVAPTDTTEGAQVEIKVQYAPPEGPAPPTGIVAEWLTDLDLEANQTENRAQSTPGTGQWIKMDPGVQEWLGEKGGILLGTGIPGSGKSVLTSTLIDYVSELAKDQDDVCIVFAYFRRTDQSSMADVLAALVKQCLKSHPGTAKFVVPMYNHHTANQSRPSETELLDVLKNILTSDLFSMSFCFLEGVDQAPRNTEVDFRSLLSTMEDIRFFITSSSLPPLNEVAPSAIHVDLSAHDSDIVMLIEDRISRVESFRQLVEIDGWRARVISSMLRKSSGMFLFCSRMLDMLQECKTHDELEETFERVPLAVAETYDGMLERIDKMAPEKRNAAIRVLIWLAYGLRWLTIAELQYAVAASPNGVKLSFPEHSLVEICCGLAALDEDSSLVYLIHGTAVTHLQSILPARVSEHPHASLAATCTFRLLECGFHNRKFNETAQIRAAFEDHPLLEYSHTNWGSHAKQCDPVPPFAEEFTLKCETFPFPSLSGFPGPYDQLDSIHVAAAYDFPNMITIEDPSDSKHANHANGQTNHGATPLMFAAKLGCMRSVQALLSIKSIDINIRDSEKRTALMYASRSGREAVVEILLKFPGVDVNAKDSSGWTALMEACSRGHQDAVRKLLDSKDIDVNAGDSKGRTALMHAIRNGHDSVAKDLTHANGIDVNAQDSSGRTALLHASSFGQEATVKDLLEVEGVDVNAQDLDGSTPLLLASASGRTEAVATLLDDPGIDVNAQNSHGQSALSYAVHGGHVGVVESLLKTAVDILGGWTEDTSHGAPLLVSAAKHGCLSLVKRLLRLGSVGVDERDLEARTALMLAASNNHHSVVQVLLSSEGADVNAQDAEGRTALMYASKEGCIPVVNTLLKVDGIDVNCQDFEGRTALTYTSENGCHDITSTLFKSGKITAVAGALGDLAAAISTFKNALAALSNEQDQAILIEHLATAHLASFEQTGSTPDIDEAISWFRKALSFRPLSHPDHLQSLKKVGIALDCRFNVKHDLMDLDESIELSRKILSLQPAPHQSRPVSLNNLATGLLDRFKRTGSIGDLDEAISLQREALDLQPPPHLNHPVLLNNLADTLQCRFRQKGDINDLEESISKCREALECQPSTHGPLDRSHALENLACGLKIRFEKSGNARDLEDAIQNHRKALAASPPGSSRRAASLHNLALVLRYRHDKSATGSRGDIDEAVKLQREAVSLLDERHPDRSRAVRMLSELQKAAKS